MLIALTDNSQPLHGKAVQWFDTSGYRDWGACAFTEAGFLRIMANPKVGSLSLGEASQVFASLTSHPGYRFWPIVDDWATLAAPFMQRVFGHQQITDAYLLGLAIKEGGILVTMDKAVKSMAGATYSRHVLILE